MEKYDVFISCKSEDYAYAESIYSFLQSNGINAFLTSMELRNLRESEYRSAITSVLKEVTHMIIFASKAEYIDSRWVFYEWDWFVNAKLKGFKQGNIVTVLKDVPVSKINADLWKYESLTLENFRETLLLYVDTENARERRRLNERSREDEKKREDLNRLLAESAEDYKQAAFSLSLKGKKVDGLLADLHLFRTCPVCGSEVSPGKSYCDNCAWSFSPIDGVESLAYLSSVDKKQVALHKQWHCGADVRDGEALDSAQSGVRHPLPKKIKVFGWIGAVVILILIVCLSGFIINNDRTSSRLWEAEWQLRLEQNRNRNLKDGIDNILDGSPVRAVNIKVWNDGDDMDTPIQSDQSTYIYHSADFIGSESLDGDIYVKFITPRGLSKGTNSPEGYSYQQHLKLSPYQPQKLTSKGWGKKTPGNWSAGDYSIEYWYKGKRIGSRFFKVL